MLIALAIAPAVLIGAAIARYAVDVPYFDEWDNDVAVHLMYLHGTLSPGELFYQSNDSRPVLPRVIWLVSDIVTHSSRRAEMWISFLCVCITSACLFVLARKTTPQHALLLLAIANWFLFSTVQYENWLWGNQLMVFLPIMLFMTALVVTYSRWRFEWKIAVAIVLWILATLSFISGLFLAPLLLAVQWLVAPSRRERWIAASAWVVAFAITALLFFRHRVALAAPARPEVFWHYPKEALAFFCCFIASPFRLTGMTWFQLWFLGALVLVMAIVPLVRSRRDAQSLRAMLPWMAMIAFALINGAAATASRLPMGLAQSQVSRYTTPTLLIPIAAVFVWIINRQRFSRPARRMAIVVGAGLLAMHLAGSFQRLSDLQQVSALRAAARDALMQINANDQDPILRELYPDLPRLKQLANEYSQLGQLPPLEPQPATR